MTTQKEVDECFVSLRRALSGRASSREYGEDARLVIMGLFLFESFLSDVKRIADSLSEAAEDRDGMGNK